MIFIVLGILLFIYIITRLLTRWKKKQIKRYYGINKKS